MAIGEQYSQIIKAEAARLGFTYCGIARAERLDEDADRLEQWLKAGMQGTMKYMEDHFEMRVDPRLIVPGAQSVITLMLNYFPEEQQDPKAPRISKYAYGKDYHEVIRTRLRELLDTIRQQIGPVQGRGFVDSAPVLERAWAVKSGLGWVGKNGNLISRKTGSFLFLATLIVDLALSYDPPFAADYCGTCTRCLDSCPTGAILPGKVVDASRCISYYTIELKEALIPEAEQGKLESWVFGCDICQDVCPWNRFSKPHEEAAFTPLKEVLNFSTSDWESLSEEAFRQIFRDSPLKRPRYSGMMRNLKAIRKS
ncbi:MAG TPA: tRNA epoxyqueuosine(34) reductase QueG [Chitinophagaceae bacterium]|nr:tRNA epoxyqueuosine(34) reductase QueG [Chitinophagaceae bacterium]